MSFSNFLRCCFPNRKEQSVIKHEESYDIKCTSEDRKSQNETAVKKEESQELFENNKGSKGSVCKIHDTSVNSVNQDNMANKYVSVQDHSFASFGVQKKSEKQINNEDNFSRTNNNEIIDLNQLSKSLQKHRNSKAKTKKNDESAIDLVNSERQISEAEIKNAPYLIVEELSGDLLRNNKLKITAAGLANGLRKLKDGVVFFGKNSDVILNDFDINTDIVTAEQGPHIFIIYFRRDTNKFYLKCYKDKQHKGQIYIQVCRDWDFPIVKKEVVLLSETYFQVTPLQEGGLEIHNLGTSNKESEGPIRYTFDKHEYKTVTVGRDSKCSISYPNDKSFSKVQATFIQDSENKIWKLKDGTSDKTSTNGSWVYATHSYEVVDKTVFQFGNSRMRISVINS